MDLAYNISEKFNGYLTRINKLRSDIVLYPIPPKTELRLKWDASLERVYWSLSMLDNPLSKKDVAALLSKHFDAPQKKLNNFQKDVINQKKALTYIKDSWQVSKNPVTMTTIKKLYDIACRETLGAMSGLTEYSEKRINTFLDYLQKGQDHPVIQAGIAQIELVNITPFDKGNSRVARLLSYLFLYKAGWDVRELISFEEYMRRDMVTYKRVIDLTKVQGNVTLWLEYFAFSVMTGLEKTLESVKNQNFQEELPASFWKLNTRQRAILEYLEDPGLSVTNKDVQKMHKVSQITASRDLTKLTNLGLLLAHGKGRSVYYTRA